MYAQKTVIRDEDKNKSTKKVESWKYGPVIYLLLGLNNQAFIRCPIMKSSEADSHDRCFRVLNHTLNPGLCLCQEKHPHGVFPASEQWV